MSPPSENSSAEPAAHAQSLRLVHVLGVVFNRMNLGLKVEDEVELTLHEARAVGVLSRVGSVKLGTFAEALGLHISTASRTIDRLVKKGLADRSSADDDRRCVLVSLSERGIRREQALLEHRADRIHDMLAPLTSHERTQLVDLLERMVPTCAFLTNKDHA